MNRVKKTYLALVFLLIFHSASFANSDTAQKILSNARAQIGCGETTGNNSGKDVALYLRSKASLPWCSGFVSFVLSRSGVKFRYTLRAKDFLTQGKKVLSPLPGDVVIFTRKGGGHVGVVEIVKHDCFISIEGNTGKFPSKVKRVKHKFQEKNLLGFRRFN